MAAGVAWRILVAIAMTVIRMAAIAAAMAMRAGRRLGRHRRLGIFRIVMAAGIPWCVLVAVALAIIGMAAMAAGRR